MKVRDPNLDCFTCGRQLPTAVAVNGTPPHVHFYCPDCGDDLLYAIISNGRTVAQPPHIRAEIPDSVNDDALRVDSNVQWRCWEVFYIDALLVSYIHGRSVFGTDEERYYVDEILDMVGENYEPR